MSVIRFTEATQAARGWLRTHRLELPPMPVLLRDLYGRIRIVFPHGGDLAVSESWLNELHSNLGPYSPGPSNLVMSGDDLLAPDAIFSAEELSPINADDPEGLRILDRLLTGADWLRPKFSTNPQKTFRATFYGIKGGVGRSTALALFARYLAAQEKKVLVLDLDLESPGVGSLLLPPDRYPAAGLVDWFVEDAVSQANTELLHSMVANSPLDEDLTGSINVVPAHGQDEHFYLPKLSRVTLDVRHDDKIENFAQRLKRLIETFESELKPDVVLLDSRAGLHDVAAVALTRLDATAFLFAAHNAQTWQSYRLLFSHWQNNYGILPAFRDNLCVVDALVPETGRSEHRKAALASAFTLFENTIYEESAPGSTNVFNFSLDDEDAPHFSLPIYWNRAFQGFDPINFPEVISQAEIDASYGEFLRTAEHITMVPNAP